MKTYGVSVTVTYELEVEVQATDEYDAIDRAEQAATDRDLAGEYANIHAFDAEELTP